MLIKLAVLAPDFHSNQLLTGGERDGQLCDHLAQLVLSWTIRLSENNQNSRCGGRRWGCSVSGALGLKSLKERRDGHEALKGVVYLEF